MELKNKTTLCTYIDLKRENITKEEFLRQLGEVLDEFTDNDTLYRISIGGVVQVEHKKDCANFREIIRTELEKMVKENPPCL